ncbi:uncharacterized protein MONOS_9986 [Monocercomonoides exilis]|uniref:uncharacterized protein n=1 Tax=Monocercomonoides exilis TaxID=2049356 RepID=UPI00355A8645|nr:hypothetical protein MONOS_9986 [Monocercomonoides exilis]|eukprot:MONOS_9986.1-p1 / transcript=MONOS_9986.1 / gene=MONOS_9986 / organism=Monocercomonoides_exilis_PA203 / gene_product=unspecified product / transcript_product=unspecified product / location=Mono_scaffold00434:1787-18077(-) / protein_length=5354 / sequence_SO=supercontig / SO=protein_coding / is_pseudo=false
MNERHSLLELYTTLVLKANNTDDILSETTQDYLNQISNVLNPSEQAEELNLPPSGEVLDGLSVFSPTQSPAKNLTTSPFAKEAIQTKPSPTSSIGGLKKFTSFEPSDLLHPLDSHKLTGFIGLIISCIDYILDIDLSPTGTFGAIPDKTKSNSTKLGGVSNQSSADFSSILEMPFDRGTFCVSLLREISLLYDALFLTSYTDLCVMQAKDYSTVIRKTSMLHHKLSIFIERCWIQPLNESTPSTQTLPPAAKPNNPSPFSFPPASAASVKPSSSAAGHQNGTASSTSTQLSKSAKANHKHSMTPHILSQIASAVRAIQLRATIVLIEAMRLEYAVDLEASLAKSKQPVSASQATFSEKKNGKEAEQNAAYFESERGSINTKTKKKEGKLKEELCSPTFSAHSSPKESQTNSLNSQNVPPLAPSASSRHRRTPSSVNASKLPLPASLHLPTQLIPISQSPGLLHSPRPFSTPKQRTAGVVASPSSTRMFTPTAIAPVPLATSPASPSLNLHRVLQPARMPASPSSIHSLPESRASSAITSKATLSVTKHSLTSDPISHNSIDYAELHPFVLVDEQRKLILNSFIQWIESSASSSSQFNRSLSFPFGSFDSFDSFSLSASSFHSFDPSSSALTASSLQQSSSSSLDALSAVLSPSAVAFGFADLNANSAACSASTATASVICVAWCCLVLKHVQCGVLEDLDPANADEEMAGENEFDKNCDSFERGRSNQFGAFGGGEGMNGLDGMPIDSMSRSMGQQGETALSSLPPLSLSQPTLMEGDTEAIMNGTPQATTIDTLNKLASFALKHKPFAYLIERLEEEEKEEEECNWKQNDKWMNGKDGSGLGDDTSEWNDAMWLFNADKTEQEANRTRNNIFDWKSNYSSRGAGSSFNVRHSATHKQVLFGFKTVLMEYICVITSTLRSSKLILPSLLSQIPQDIIEVIQQHDDSLPLPSPSSDAISSALATSLPQQPPRPTLGSLLTYLSEITHTNVPSASALFSLLSVVTYHHPKLAGLYWELSTTNPSLASLLSDSVSSFPADSLPAIRLYSSLSQDSQSASQVCEAINHMESLAVIVPVSHLLHGRASFGWKSVNSEGQEIKWDEDVQMSLNKVFAGEHSENNLGKEQNLTKDGLAGGAFDALGQIEMEALQEKAALYEEELLNAQHIPFIKLKEEFAADRNVVIPSGFEGQIVGCVPLARAIDDPLPLSFTLPIPLHFLNSIGLVVRFFPPSPYPGWPFLLRPFFSLSSARSPSDILNPPIQMPDSCSSWQKVTAEQSVSSLSTTHAALLLIHSLIRAHPPIHKVIDQQLSSMNSIISAESTTSTNTSSSTPCSIFDDSSRLASQSSPHFPPLSSSQFSSSSSSLSQTSSSILSTSQANSLLQTQPPPVSVANVCILLIHSISSQLTSSSVVSSSSESERKQLLELSSLALRTLTLLVPCWLPFCRSSCCPNQFVTSNGTISPEYRTNSLGNCLIGSEKSLTKCENSIFEPDMNMNKEQLNIQSAQTKRKIAEQVAIEMQRITNSFVSLFSTYNVELNTVIHDAINIVTSTESKIGSYQTLLALLRLCRVVASSARCIKLPVLSVSSIIKEVSETAAVPKATELSSSVPVPLKQEEPNQLFAHDSSTVSSSSLSSSVPLDLLSISSFDSHPSVASLLSSFPLSNPSMLLSEMISIIRRDVFVMIPNVWIHHNKLTKLLLMLRCTDMFRFVLQSLPIEVAISNRKRRIRRLKFEAARNANAKAEEAKRNQEIKKRNDDIQSKWNNVTSADANNQPGRWQEFADFEEYDDGIDDMFMASVEDSITADEKEKQLFPSREATSMENTAIAALTRNIGTSQSLQIEEIQSTLMKRNSAHQHLANIQPSSNPLHQSRAELLASLKTDLVLQKALLTLTASGGLSMEIATQLSASGQQNIATVLEETVTACLEVVEIVLISLEFDWREKESSQPSDLTVKEQESKVSEMMNGIGSGSNVSNTSATASSPNESVKGKQANSSSSASALRDLSQFERLILTFLVDVPSQDDDTVNKQIEHKETAASKLLKELLETRKPNDSSKLSSESILKHSDQLPKQEPREWLLVLASYVAYQSNNKISTVSTRILTHLCRMSIRFPQLPPLIRFFGSEKQAMQLKDAIVMRFADPNTPHSVSAAVVEFISAAIDYQPLLAKLFVENVFQLDDQKRNRSNILNEKTSNINSNPEAVLSENSFLGFSLSLLCDHLEETANERPALLAGLMLLLRKMWEKCDIFGAAVEALVVHEGFWKAIQRVAVGVGKKLRMMSGRREGKWLWKGREKELIKGTIESNDGRSPDSDEADGNKDVMEELRTMRKQKLKWQLVLTPSCLLSAYASNDMRRYRLQRYAKLTGGSEDASYSNEMPEDSILFRTLRNLLKKWDRGERGSAVSLSASLRRGNEICLDSTTRLSTTGYDMNIDEEAAMRLVESQREEEKKIEEIDKAETMDIEQSKAQYEDRKMREMKRMKREMKKNQRRMQKEEQKRNNADEKANDKDGNEKSDDKDEESESSESSSTSPIDLEEDDEEEDEPNDDRPFGENEENEYLSNKTRAKTEMSSANFQLLDDASYEFDRTLERELKKDRSNSSSSKGSQSLMNSTQSASLFNDSTAQKQPLWVPAVTSSSSVYSNDEDPEDSANDEMYGTLRPSSAAGFFMSTSSSQEFADQMQSASPHGASPSSSIRRTPRGFASLSPKRTASAMKRLLRATCHLSALETARSVAFDLITIELSSIAREAQRQILRVLLEGEKTMESKEKTATNTTSTAASSSTKAPDKSLPEVYIEKAFKLLNDAEKQMKNVVGSLLSPACLTELMESVTESISAEPSFRSLLSFVCRMNGVDLDSYRCAHSTPERSLYSGDAMFEFHATYFEKALMMGCFDNSDLPSENRNTHMFPIHFIPYLMRLSNASSFRRNSRIRTLASWKRFVSTAALCRSMIPAQPIWNRTTNESENEEMMKVMKMGDNGQGTDSSSNTANASASSLSQQHSLADGLPLSSPDLSSSSRRIVLPSPLLRAVYRSISEGVPIEVFKPLSLVQLSSSSSSSSPSSESDSKQLNFAPFELIPSTTVHLLCAIIMGIITHILAYLTHSTDATHSLLEGKRKRLTDKTLNVANTIQNSTNSINPAISMISANNLRNEGASGLTFEERLAEQSVTEAMFLLRASEQYEESTSSSTSSSNQSSFSNKKTNASQIPFTSHFLRAVVEQKEAAKQNVSELMNELLLLDDVGRLAQFDVLTALLSLLSFLTSLCEECPKPMNPTHYFLRFDVESEYIPVKEVVDINSYGGNSPAMRFGISTPSSTELSSSISSNSPSFSLLKSNSLLSLSHTTHKDASKFSQIHSVPKPIVIINSSAPLIQPSCIPLSSPVKSDGSLNFLKQTTFSSPLHYALSIRLLSASSVPPSLNIFSAQKQESSSQTVSSMSLSPDNGNATASFDSLLSLPYFSRPTFAPYSIVRPPSFPKPSVAGLPLSFAVCLFTQLAKCFAACLRCLFPLKSRHLSAIVSAITSIVHLLPSIPSVVPLMKIEEVEGYSQSANNSTKNASSSSFAKASLKNSNNSSSNSIEKEWESSTTPRLDHTPDLLYSQFKQPTSFADFDEGRLISPMNQMMSETSSSSSASILQSHLNSVISSFSSNSPATKSAASSSYLKSSSMHNPSITFSAHLIDGAANSHSFPTFAPIPRSSSSGGIQLSPASSRAKQAPFYLSGGLDGIAEEDDGGAENEGKPKNDNKKGVLDFARENDKNSIKRDKKEGNTKFCEMGFDKEIDRKKNIFQMLEKSVDELAELEEGNNESPAELTQIEDDIAEQRLFCAAVVTESFSTNSSSLQKVIQSLTSEGADLKEQLQLMTTELEQFSPALTSYLLSRHFPVFPSLYHYSRFVQHVAYNVTRGCIALINYHTPSAPLRPGLKMIVYTLIVCLIQRILFRRCTLIPDAPQKKEELFIDEAGWDDSMLKLPGESPHIDGASNYANPSAVRCDTGANISSSSSSPFSFQTVTSISKQVYGDNYQSLPPSPSRYNYQTTPRVLSSSLSSIGMTSGAISYRQIITPLNFNEIIHCLRLDDSNTLAQIFSGLTIPLSNIKMLSFLRIPRNITINYEDISNHNMYMHLSSSTANSSSSQETSFIPITSSFIKNSSTFSPTSQFNFRFVQLNLSLIQSLLVAQPFLASFFFNAGLINKLKAIADNLIGSVKEEYKTWDKSRLAAESDNDGDLSFMTPAYFRAEYAQQIQQISFLTSSSKENALGSTQSEEEILSQPFNTPTMPYLPNGEINTQHRIWCFILTIITALVHSLLIQHNWKNVESTIKDRNRATSCYGIKTVDTKLGLNEIQSSKITGKPQISTEHKYFSELPSLSSVLIEVTKFVNERLLLMLPSLVRKTYPYNHLTINGLIEARLVISLIIAIAQLSNKCGEEAMKQEQNMDGNKFVDFGQKRVQSTGVGFGKYESEYDKSSTFNMVSESSDSESDNESEDGLQVTRKLRYYRDGDLLTEERRLKAMKHFHEDIVNLASPLRIEAVLTQLAQSGSDNTPETFSSFHRSYPWTQPSMFLERITEEILSSQHKKETKSYLDMVPVSDPTHFCPERQQKQQEYSFYSSSGNSSTSYPFNSSAQRKQHTSCMSKLTLNRISAMDGSDQIFGLMSLPLHRKSAIRSMHSFPHPLLPLHPSIILSLNELFSSLMQFLSTPTAVLKELLPVTVQEKVASLDPYAQATHSLHSKKPEQQPVVVATISAPSFYSLSSHALATGSLFKSIGYPSVLGTLATDPHSIALNSTSLTSKTGGLAPVGFSTAASSSSSSSSSASATVLSSPFGETIISLMTTIIEQIICCLRIISPLNLRQPPLPKRKFALPDTEGFYSIGCSVKDNNARTTSKTSSDSISISSTPSNAASLHTNLSSQMRSCMLCASVPQNCTTTLPQTHQSAFQKIPNVPCLLLLPVSRALHHSLLPPFTISINLILSFIDLNTASLRLLRHHPVFTSSTSSSSAGVGTAPLASVLLRANSTSSVGGMSTFMKPSSVRSRSSASAMFNSPSAVGRVQSRRSVTPQHLPSSLIASQPSQSISSLQRRLSSVTSCRTLSANSSLYSVTSSRSFIRYANLMKTIKTTPGFFHPKLGVLIPTSFIGVYQKIPIFMNSGNETDVYSNEYLDNSKSMDTDGSNRIGLKSPSIASLPHSTQIDSRINSLPFGSRLSPPPSTPMSIASLKRRSTSPSSFSSSASRSSRRGFSHTSSTIGNHHQFDSISPEALLLKYSTDSTRIAFGATSHTISIASKPFISQRVASIVSEKKESNKEFASSKQTSNNSPSALDFSDATPKTNTGEPSSLMLSSKLQLPFSISLTSIDLSFTSLQSLRSDIFLKHT